ncbi:MAG: hypothetical protein RML40_03290 [Bacteroidota bacterium]|nr:hypothetical protein [Candidatus Kapabacteria bacterium]MDW8219535.1 hypothetical protein [Bacteroidota bacterium]
MNSKISRWSVSGLYRVKASYPLTIQNSLCGGDCDYMFAVLPGGEFSITAFYAIRTTLGVQVEASWTTHGYTYRGMFSQNMLTGERTTPQYSVVGRYILIAPSLTFQEEDSSGYTWRWTAGAGLGIPLGVTITRTDIAANGSVVSDRYIYPSVRLLEPLVDMRLGTMIPLFWKGLYLTALLNYNLTSLFKINDSFSHSVERAHALGIALGVQYSVPIGR